MSPAEVSEGLGLDTLKNRSWSIHKSCAIKGEGLEEGLDWCVPCGGGCRLQPGDVADAFVCACRLVTSLNSK